MSELVAGADYGARRVALAVFDARRVELVELSVINLDRYSEKGTHDLADDIHSLVGWWRRRVGDREFPVWLETPVARHLPGGKTGSLATMNRLAMTVGGLLSAHRGPVHLVRPSSWKLEVTGHGNADKVAVAEWLHATAPEIAAACAGDEDAVDACCLGLYGAGARAGLGAPSGL